jgi:hypothetical protein
MNDILDTLLNPSADINVSKVLEPNVEVAVQSHNIEQFVQDVMLTLHTEHLYNTKIGDAIIQSLHKILEEKHPQYSHLVYKYIILI